MNSIIIMQLTRYYNPPWYPRVTMPQAKFFLGSQPYWEHPAVRDLEYGIRLLAILGTAPVPASRADRLPNPVG